jgi:hypothetical protein
MDFFRHTYAQPHERLFFLKHKLELHPAIHRGSGSLIRARSHAPTHPLAMPRTTWLAHPSRSDADDAATTGAGDALTPLFFANRHTHSRTNERTRTRVGPKSDYG